MSRIFWDAMLFIYLLEGHKKYAPQVRSLLEKSYKRGDVLLTSYLALAEVLVGAQPGTPTAKAIHSTVEEMGFSFVEFNRQCVEPFRMLRTQYGLRGPDAMHLACAAAAKTDLFLTGDGQLLKKHLHVPGIHFIADFENPPL
jgi:predicted nucleic acid-binding protein